MPYESETDSPSGAVEMCRIPAKNFRVSFQPSNDYDKGLGVAIIVDGVLCTSKEAALALLEKRVSELHKLWVTHIEKM